MSVSALVKAHWLRQLIHQGSRHVRVLDASWHLPNENRDPIKEFLTQRIPGARFFDIEECVDKTSPYEHMLPNAEDFSNYVRKLGVTNDSHVVVYDNNVKSGLFSAPRVWWMLRSFGHDKVSILDGGLPRWCAEGYPTESGPESVTTEDDGGPFKASMKPGMFCDFDFVKANLSEAKFQVADARSPGRFHGTEGEPRPGFPAGHIPHSKSVHYAQCLDPDTKLMKDPEELRKVFQDAGIDLSKPLVTSCGSGITACLVALASHLCGKTDTVVYDGSWVEWGQRASPEMVEKN